MHSLHHHLDSLRNMTESFFEIKNTGLGPAIIKEITWISDRKRYKNPTIEEFKDYLQDINLNFSWVVGSTLAKESWIGKGELRPF